MPVKKFFKMLADDWGKPLSKLQEYLGQLESEMVDTVQDLEHLIADAETWGKVTSSWPIALPKRIEA